MFVLVGYVVFEKFCEKYRDFFYSQIRSRDVIFSEDVILHVKNVSYFPWSFIVWVIIVNSIVTVWKVETSKTM
jgi:hypothetical protein